MKRQTIAALLFAGITSSGTSFAQSGISADSTLIVSDSIQAAPDSIKLEKTSIVNEEISVVAFKRLPNDLTARVTSPKRDQNNEVCAIIKVVTKDKALFFEPDALGIIAREDQPGEIWLYVPHGAKRITIKHERYGIIRNYFYNESIDKATVYELVLYIPNPKDQGTRIIERFIEKKATEQALMMNYSPAKAQIYIDGELQLTNDNGAFSKILPLGPHSYRVVAPHFTEEKGAFDIVSERPTALNIAIKPTYGFINVISQKEETRIFFNKEFVGEAPHQSDTLNIGTYTVRAERKWYLPQEQEAVVNPTETTSLLFKLKRQKPNLFLIPQYGTAVKGGSQTSFGLMAGVCRKAGAYLNVRTNGNLEFGDNYVRNSYGLYSGNVQKHHFSTTAGFMARLARPVYLYWGGGYIFRTVDWEISPNVPISSSGSYQTVQYHTGGLVEAGLIGRYKFLSVSAGVACGINEDGFGNYMEAVFGIGFVIGK